MVAVVKRWRRCGARGGSRWRRRAGAVRRGPARPLCQAGSRSAVRPRRAEGCGSREISWYSDWQAELRRSVEVVHPFFEPRGGSRRLPRCEGGFCLSRSARSVPSRSSASTCTRRCPSPCPAFFLPASGGDEDRGCRGLRRDRSCRGVPEPASATTICRARAMWRRRLCAFAAEIISVRGGRVVLVGVYFVATTIRFGSQMGGR